MVDFTRVFGLRVDDHPHWAYSTRRIWKIFNHFKPSINLSPFTTPWADDYPFSVEPDFLVSVQNITDVKRSHYENTEFDMTKGLAAGPFSDPDRYDLSASLDGTVPIEVANSGFYERSISIYRTSTTVISQVRGFMPNLIGPRIWFGVYAPSGNTYSPIYLSAADIPDPYMKGSLFQYDPTSMFWLHCSVGNYVNRFRKFAIEDIKRIQEEIESWQYEQAVLVDQAALALGNDTQSVEILLTQFSNDTVLAAHQKWLKLFPKIVTKYHDGYRFPMTSESLDVTPENFFYDEDWLTATGYFDTIVKDIEMLKERKIIPDSVPSTGPLGNLEVRNQLLAYKIPLNLSAIHGAQSNTEKQSDEFSVVQGSSPKGATGQDTSVQSGSPVHGDDDQKSSTKVTNANKFEQNEETEKATSAFNNSGSFSWLFVMTCSAICALAGFVLGKLSSLKKNAKLNGAINGSPESYSAIN